MCLFVLVVMAWTRGAAIGKNWLPVLPGLAAFFDLLPGLNWIPLLPTGLHVATVIAGAILPDSAALAARSAIPLRADKKFWTLAAGCAVFLALFLSGTLRFSARTTQNGVPIESSASTGIPSLALRGSEASTLSLLERTTPSAATSTPSDPSGSTTADSDNPEAEKEAGGGVGSGLDSEAAAELEPRGQTFEAKPSDVPAMLAPEPQEAVSAAAAAPAAGARDESLDAELQSVPGSASPTPNPPRPARTRPREIRERVQESNPLEDAKIEAARLMITDPCAAAQRLQPYLADERIRGMHRIAQENCRR
jgi:hypothetical protein